MKRIFLVAMAAIITAGAFADGGNKKPAGKTCDKQQCSQECMKKCNGTCCDKATAKKN